MASTRGGCGAQLRGAMLLAIALAGAAAAHAQTVRETPSVPQQRGGGGERPDTIAGRVADAQGSAVAAPEIRVTRSPDRRTVVGRPDSLGYYRLVVSSETGDYLLHVAALGYQSVRKRLTRGSGGGVLDGNVVLVPAVTRLAATVVEAERPMPTHDESGLPDPQGIETIVGGVAAAFPPDVAGNVMALGATAPGVRSTSTGISVLGLPAERSTVTLNGALFSGGQIPRLARTTTRVTTSTYDPARGGFEAAQVAIELAPGFAFGSRVMSAAGSPGWPRAASSGGAPVTQGSPRSASVSVGVDGPLLDSERWTYSASAEASYRNASANSVVDRLNDGSSLGYDPSAIDSAVTGLATHGLLGTPFERAVDRHATAMARVDHTPDAASTWGVLGYLDAGRVSGIGNTPFVGAASTRSQDQVTAMLTARGSTLVRHRVLTENAITLSLGWASDRPRQLGPSAIVGIAASDSSRATTVEAGGGAPEERRSWALQIRNETQWYSNAHHRLKVGIDATIDGTAGGRDASDANGVFSFNSPSDFVAGNAASFARTIEVEHGGVSVWNGAAFLGDWWHPTPGLEVVGGLRAEGGGGTRRRRLGDGIAALLEVSDNDGVAHWNGLSPRLGFSWLYGRPARGASINSLGSFLDGPRGVLRGGFGLFRSNLRPAVIQAANRYTGDRSAAQQVICVGAATPFPQWERYAIDPSSVPRSCVDGTPAMAESGRTVAFLVPGYSPPASWRSTLGWSGFVRSVAMTIDGTYSWHLHQPSGIDQNFSGATAFTLPGERDRPVFATLGGIDEATGAVAAGEARRTRAFTSVQAMQSDLRGRSAQLTVTFSPTLSQDRVFRAAYTFARSSTQSRGFDAPTGIDPRDVELRPSALDVRHQLQLEVGTSLPHGLSVTGFSRLRSGLPYTPVVRGDVNGDGVGGDRAFVFGPSSDNSQVGASIARLMARSGSASACLAPQVGRLAELHSCRGPWVLATNMRIGLSPAALALGERVSASLFVENVSGLADHLLHGAHTRGWGEPTIPDPVLLTITGFDPATRQWRYATNGGFASALPTARANMPVRITAEIDVDIGTPLPEQLLKRSLDAGRRGHSGSRMTADELALRYERTVPNVFATLAELSDSLLLSPSQLRGLQEADDAYRAAVRPEWRALGIYLAALDDSYSTNDALRQITATTTRVWAIAQRDAQRLREIVTPIQLRLAPPTVATVLNASGPLTFRFTPAP